MKKYNYNISIKMIIFKNSIRTMLHLKTRRNINVIKKKDIFAQHI